MAEATKVDLELIGIEISSVTGSAIEGKVDLVAHDVDLPQVIGQIDETDIFPLLDFARMHDYVAKNIDAKE